MAGDSPTLNVTVLAAPRADPSVLILQLMVTQWFPTPMSFDSP